MSLLWELRHFMKTRKKYWLAPVLIVLVCLGGLIALTSASGVLAPLLYPLF